MKKISLYQSLFCLLWSCFNLNASKWKEPFHIHPLDFWLNIGTVRTGKIRHSVFIRRNQYF
ncbi:uncharacterized protein METZ01_LOCUS364323 [marine metagenome]|uniref:Uncharacterized protein n=1 Tax=marine metagenome TaxID=408172 RepID=A0A382SNK1_9ZZZZ